MPMRILVLGLIALAAGCAAPGLSRSRAEPRSIEEVRAHPERGQRLGVVAKREVKLDRLELHVREGRSCPRRRLPSAEGEIVTASAADRAGCRLFPYRGELPVFAVASSGERVRVLMLQTSLEGDVELRYARADASLRALGVGSLDDYDRLELGRGAWAGSVDLVRLRQFLADWHFRWVSRGRGSPGLFAILHPEDEHAEAAEQWAAQDRLRRQEEDKRLVEAGELSPEAFLERHVWSPYRDAVKKRDPMTTAD
jgi:hypothetical protein